MGRLILVRHGETDKNTSNSLHSANDPEKLNEKGRQQILLTAKKLKEYAPIKVYASKEIRAAESAKIISGTLNIPIKKVNGLEERNWGALTGRPWGDIKKILDPMSLTQRYEYVPEDGESWKTFEERLVKTIRTITDEDRDKTVIVVTHGGAIRALIPCLLNIPREESFKFDPQNASISIFDFQDNTFRKIAIDDVSHLSMLDNV
jgi:broad specificity phosphatase PhoE